MRTVRSTAELRAALVPPRRAGRSIGLVPTMGAFHEGHLSLMRRARQRCDVVVVSLFVNPAQFGPGEDLAAYPRDEERDAALAAGEGVDLLFAPPASEVYPDGFRTTVAVGDLTGVLCGSPESRGPEHFRGVTTVVAKLLNMVQPDIAVFGQKDAQQARVVRQMVKDLDFPVEIDVSPTVREPDGVAMSSRNKYLKPDDRKRAAALPRALEAARAVLSDPASAPASGAGTPVERALAAAHAELAAAGIDPEYVEVVSADDLGPPERLDRDLLVAIAARVGSARLIDNVPVRVGSPTFGDGGGAAREEIDGRMAQATSGAQATKGPSNST